MPGSKKSLKKWVVENIPTTGETILHGKFDKEGGQEGGDPGSGKDKDMPPKKPKGKERNQGEEDLGREMTQKS